MSIFSQLEGVEGRFEALEAQLGSPEIASDPNRMRDLMREYSHLKEVVDAYRSWRSMGEELEGAREMLGESDPDMREMAKEEIDDLEPRIAQAEKALKLLLLPQDPHEGRDVLLEIRAGVGGDEAGLFAADLFRMYMRYGESRGWRFDIMNTSHNDAGGFKEVIAAVKGPDVYQRLKYESGVHRVQRVPATEAQGRIHTSTCTVALMPEADPVEIHIDEGDLRIDVFRASGPGGQSVNTTDSAVRITHLPTGLTVICQDEKSQHKNKAKALTVLRARLYERERLAKQAEERDMRNAQVGTGDRSERIRTYNFPQGRLTDHRIGLTVYTVDKVIQGDLEDVLDACAAYFEARALEQLEGDE
jgi:peptide chain release factor 1